MNNKYLLIAGLLLACMSATAGEWYEGGTLHKATAQKWHAATSGNQLATSADFLAATKAASSMAQLKTRSYALRSCITEATNDPILFNLMVPDVAALCIVQLGYK